MEEVEGVPLVIVENGQLARQQGIDDLGRVRLGVLETSGRMSFINYDG